MSTVTDHHPVVCFGEVLWDILPWGRLPGGAPVNVAYHLTRLGKNPALITRVGTDASGEELTRTFASLGVCTDHFQQDAIHPTGRVVGQPDANGDMVYDIESPAAWDYISGGEATEALVARSQFFVFGSLACRNEVSRQTLMGLLEAAPTRVLDINLRTPFYDRSLLEDLLRKCDILKLNQQELELIAGWYGNMADMGKRNSIGLLEESIRLLAYRFNLRSMTVTRGAEGAILFADNRFYHHPGCRVKVADTVGAGDAFLAGLIAGLYDQAPYEEILRSASLLGAFVAASRGACPVYDQQTLFDFSSQTI